MSGNRNRPASGRISLYYTMNTMNHPNGNAHDDDGHYPHVHITGHNNTVVVGAADAMWQQGQFQAYGVPAGSAAPHGRDRSRSRSPCRVRFAEEPARGGAFARRDRGDGNNHGDGGSHFCAGFSYDHAGGGGAWAGHDHWDGHNAGHNHCDGCNRGDGHSHGDGGSRPRARFTDGHARGGMETGVAMETETVEETATTTETVAIIPFVFVTEACRIVWLLR